MNITKLNQEEALEAIGGSSLKGYLHNIKYSQLIRTIGQPTFEEESGDGKVQFEWVFKFNGEIFTIYDWKTYDIEYSINELTTWNVGGKSNAYDFIDYIENLVKEKSTVNA